MFVRAQEESAAVRCTALVAGVFRQIRCAVARGRRSAAMRRRSGSFVLIARHCPRVRPVRRDGRAHSSDELLATVAIDAHPAKSAFVQEKHSHSALKPTFGTVSSTEHLRHLSSRYPQELHRAYGDYTRILPVPVVNCDAHLSLSLLIDPLIDLSALQCPLQRPPSVL